MNLNSHEKLAILRGLLEIKENKIGQAIKPKINIDKLIKKIQNY